MAIISVDSASYNIISNESSASATSDIINIASYNQNQLPLCLAITGISTATVTVKCGVFSTKLAPLKTITSNESFAIPNFPFLEITISGSSGSSISVDLFVQST